ncbi:uncharacterized protein [Triticum aestivum]|uniref:uncharacterized protein isoform X1 n=1 Tax=Triticum aestivum TaxID=4565 RepID=UPI001D027C38|nr:uncharacterized protein LOC123081804 isoform X1 [Triticum aestivum]XP_044360262.1 uncharacterized protein LOC123081804 isoform X1 [Triticum aestivum]
MGQQSKRTRAPAPREAPPPAPLLTPPPAHLLVPPPAHLLVSPAPKSAPPPGIPSAFPSKQRTSTWIPPRPQESLAASLQQASESGPTAQGPCWAPPACIGDSTSPWYMAGNMDYSDPQVWGVDSHPPGGYLSYFQNTAGPTQPMHNGSSPQPVNAGDDTNGGDCGRTEKRLLWTKQEDLRLVSAWLNNSNDPIQSNYRKNEQYWKDVTAVYNSTTPKNRERLVKQVKDRFGRIKKRVAWFCASYKEASALYASGESDADLKKRAMQTYEEDHKKDGPFMFEHCWEILKKEPKWDAYLERLEDLEPDKRKFSVDDEVGKHSTIDDDDDEDERPPGGKQAKEKQKRKRKDEVCIIDLEDGLQKFVDAQNAANEGRKEMLETQRHVSAENLEARKLAHLAAKDHKESVMLETYRSLVMQDTTGMPEDVRSEHVLALKCLREKLFGKMV